MSDHLEVSLDEMPQLISELGGSAQDAEAARNEVHRLRGQVATLGPAASAALAYVEHAETQIETVIRDLESLRQDVTERVHILEGLDPDWLPEYVPGQGFRIPGLDLPIAT